MTAVMEGYRQREIRRAPGALVEDGRWVFGTFNSQFGRVNALDADRPLGFRVPRPLLGLRLKEWQAFQLGNSRWFMLAVIYNAKVSALAQFIAYDRLQNRKYVFERILPPWAVRVPADISDSSQSYLDAAGSVEIVSALSRGRFFINVKVSARDGLPGMEGSFEAFHDAGDVEPIVVSIPFGPNRGMYSHKCLMPMQGFLSVDGERTEFLRCESFAIIDDHKGLYPYVMHYDWVTAAGFDGSGRLLGFNLTDNQSTDPDKYNENCLWAGGRLKLLPAVTFSRPQGVAGPWQVRDRFGMVDLTFETAAMGSIDMNLLALRVKYFGPLGYCSGTIRDAGGETFVFDRYFGMGEQKYIRG